MIRKLEAIDIPYLLDDAELSFYKQKVIPSHIDFSSYDLHEFLVKALEDERFGCFVCDHGDHICGAIGGMVMPTCYNSSQFILMEFGWWVFGERKGRGDGIRLLKRLEEWGKNMGAILSVMEVGMGEDGLSTESMLNRMGYMSIEHKLAKPL